MLISLRKSPLYQNIKQIRLTVKTKIWMAVTSIVLLFSFFVLFYLPAIQEKTLLNNFNKEVQNQANTVALGVKIAMTEQNFEGVQTAMDFVKKDPLLRFVSLLQTDTVWNTNHTTYKINRTVFKTYPDNKQIDVNATSNDSTVIKRTNFSTPIMHGEVVLAFSTREIIQGKRKIRITSLFFSFLVFSIGIGIGFGLARSISIPVLKLRDAATKVGRGDLTQRVSSKSRDEIGELGLAFNKMVTDLSTARQELEDRTKELIKEKEKSDDLFEGLNKTLTDLKETQEQLIRQEKLASIGQLTKGLVDRLLNPLNYVNNFAAISNELLDESREILSKDAYAADEYIQAELVPLLTMIETNTEKIREHGNSLTRIIKSMDKLLQVKSDIFIETDINAFIENQLAAYKNEIDETHHHITFELVQEPGSNCTTKIVPAEMSSVIYNIINNAIYALHEKSLIDTTFQPKITIKTASTDQDTEIIIQDNGNGISDIEKQQLFSPFFTTKPTSKGVGLGLFISQDIIKMHKGSITVETELNSFTTFTIRLPLSPAAENA
ncbi:HAMP domain-containing protein [Hymenobacter taeanensis]|uniref:histidine kinase n=1 Tax=Hymenobacter taeanensis TaxID=2735321 RepID=A0A6M6BE49_9BACT|nr:MULTISPECIES: HAMP domain-containing sensor histidine kinase [Hymenobacter]QJX45513.1 HAMP domain-containing protein [Hymenobacter taeanensis]UOQ81239.1 ATP-binding protein [Hymenobacter sp. 5414T-23]